MQILVILFAVAIGTFVLNRAAKRRDDAAQKEQRQREQDIETERAEESSLQAYLDYISQLLTDPDRPLRRTHMGDNLSVVARAQTLTVLGRLEDGERNSSVLQFLHEAGLIDRTCPVVNLRGADLRGANREADLQADNLPEASVSRADLHGARYLEQVQIDQAIGDDYTTLPEGIDDRNHGVPVPTSRRLSLFTEMPRALEAVEKVSDARL